MQYKAGKGQSTKRGGGGQRKIGRHIASEYTTNFIARHEYDSKAEDN